MGSPSFMHQPTLARHASLPSLAGCPSQAHQVTQHLMKWARLHSLKQPTHPKHASLALFSGCPSPQAHGGLPHHGPAAAHVCLRRQHALQMDKEAAR
eukprot:1144255-Pelagomonas_calceolata.AAC.7